MGLALPLLVVNRRPLAVLAVLPLLLAGCSGSDTAVTPGAAASAPVPGVTLPPGDLRDLVPTPAEVPAGMVPVLKGSGQRTLDVVAGYSGTGAAATKAAAALRAHGFQSAYVAQYASQTTGQVLSVLVSQFATAAGATADFVADQQQTHAAPVVAPTVGDASVVTSQPVAGKGTGTLVLLRFRRDTRTWVIAYQAAPTADPRVAEDLAKRLLARAEA